MSGSRYVFDVKAWDGHSSIMLARVGCRRGDIGTRRILKRKKRKSIRIRVAYPEASMGCLRGEDVQPRQTAKCKNPAQIKETQKLGKAKDS